MDIDTYKRIVAANGTNIANAYTNTTIAKMNDAFADSPFYASIPINGTNTDVRIVESDDKDPDKKTLLFRPNTIINRGSIATIGSYNWMVEDFNDNALFPKSNIMRCTDILKWVDKNNVTHQYDCVSKALSSYDISIKTGMIDTPYNKLLVSVPYNSDTTSIILEQRFLFKHSAYRVIGKDDVSKVLGNYGYITIVMEQVQANGFDNFTTGIADNSVIYGASSSGSSPSPGGGKPW